MSSFSKFSKHIKDVDPNDRRFQTRVGTSVSAWLRDFVGRALEEDLENLMAAPYYNEHYDESKRGVTEIIMVVATWWDDAQA